MVKEEERGGTKQHEEACTCFPQLATQQSLSPGLFSSSTFQTHLFIIHMQRMKTNTPLLPLPPPAPFSALTLFLFHHSREEIASLANISVNFSKNFKKQKSSPTWQSVKHSVVVCLFSRRSQTPQQHRDVAPDTHLMPVISLKLKTYYKRLLWEYLL